MIENKIKVLVLGVTGMLGNTVFRVLSVDDQFDVTGTARSMEMPQLFPKMLSGKIMSGVDIENIDSLINVLSDIKPQVVINCIGLVKQLTQVNNPLIALPLNALFPHRLAELCTLGNARVIHISTDCVFSGVKGGYSELDIPDAQDLYGVSKRLGEIDYENAVTLRTSIIGHELKGSRSLVDWFLSQEGDVNGYIKAIFSGLPTVELANIIKEYVIPNPQLTGVHHVSSDPINKFELLNLIAKIYGKKINIIQHDGVEIDRSLDSTNFRMKTGYRPPSWTDLVKLMYKFK